MCSKLPTALVKLSHQREILPFFPLILSLWGAFKEDSSATERKVTWCGSQRSARSLPVPFKRSVAFSQRGKEREKGRVRERESERCFSIGIKESLQTFSFGLRMDVSERCDLRWLLTVELWLPSVHRWNFITVKTKTQLSTLTLGLLSVLVLSFIS